MMQGAIHGDEVGGLWQGKLMDITFIKMQAIGNTLALGLFRSLADVFGETIQPQTTQMSAACGECPQIPAIAASQVHRQPTASIDFGKDGDGRADFLLERLAKIVLQHQPEPRQNSFAFGQHLFTGTLPRAHETRRPLRHVCRKYGTHRYANTAVFGFRAHAVAILTQPPLPVIGQLQPAKGIGGITPAQHVAGIHPGSGRQRCAVGVAQSMEGAKKPVDDANESDIQG